MTEPATTIWVIEDSPTQALRLQITLEEQGWTTWWAVSAEDALDHLNDGLPDLALVDLNLPGISGDEFARRVRMSMRTRNLALLILTDSDNAESQRRGFESGADDYVPKSAPNDVLLLRIRNLLRRSAGPVLAGSMMPAFRRSKVLILNGAALELVAPLARFLEQERHLVELVDAADAVLPRIEAEPFDCVALLLTRMSPEMLELCARLDLARRRADQSFQIVVLSGATGTQEMLHALRAGADDFVDLRGGPEIFGARIGAQLRRKFLQEESVRIADEYRERTAELEQARAETRIAEARAALVEALEQTNHELATSNAKLQDMQSELTRAKEKAEEATRAKSHFLAAMSHEIRTPMTGVLGMADLLAADSLTAVQRQYVETIRSSGSHLLSIINDILDFSRIEAGRLDLERLDFAPAVLVEQVRSLLAPQATERSLALRLAGLPAADLVLLGDPTRIRQILVNLVGNALKFTAQGEVVLTLRVQAPPGPNVTIRFEVRDTGIGIPSDRQPALFKAFVQAESSTNRHFGGSGLGLAICKRLVEAMGGAIGVESVSGEGSTFWFELCLPRGSASEVLERQLVTPEGIPPLRVLMADDVPANRELVSAMLARHGHHVDLAENGAEAVELAGRGAYDVVLMDVQMPIMNGLEAVRRIRELPPPAAAVPILALTANVMADEQRRYLAAGMDRCLVKPIVWADLFAALAAVAAGALHAGSAAVAVPVSTTGSVTTQPLLDQDRIDGMAGKMPAGMLWSMLVRGLDGAQESCRRLQTAAGDGARLTAEAHRLRGTAGTFGFARLAALAGAIEVRVGEGAEAADLVAGLQAIMDATRGAVAKFEC